MKRELGRIPPNGKYIGEFVDCVLKHECSWMHWKYLKKNKCPGIKKSKLERKLSEMEDFDENESDEPPRKRQRLEKNRNKEDRLPLMGSKELGQLWQNRPKCFESTPVIKIDNNNNNRKNNSNSNGTKNYYKPFIGEERRQARIVPKNANAGMEWLAQRSKSTSERVDKTLQKIRTKTYVILFAFCIWFGSILSCFVFFSIF